MRSTAILFGIEKFERGIEREESGEGSGGAGQTWLMMRYQALGQIGGDGQLLQVEAVLICREADHREKGVCVRDVAEKHCLVQGG